MTQNPLFKQPIPIRTIDELADDCSVIANVLREDSSARNKLKFCPVCNARIEDRNVAIYQELIADLYRTYVWLGKQKRNTFNIKEIRDKISKNNYARFGDLVRFGGLVYKFKDEEGKKLKGKYGLNMGRCKEFFHGQRTIPVQITLNQITNEIIDAKYVHVSEIPSLRTYIDANGLYDHEKQNSGV